MQKILSLQFDFDHGICKSIKNGQEALLCSPHSATRDCWTYDGTLMRPTLKLKKAHEKGALVDAYGKILAVAGPNIDVEELTDKTWAHVGDMKGVFLNVKKYQEFTLESIANRVLAFGGYEGGSHDESHFVYQMDLDTFVWSRFRKCHSLRCFRVKAIFSRDHAETKGKTSIGGYWAQYYVGRW